MAGGFFALLDDIAALAKMAAASMDDVAAGATKASIKSVGVIIDDTAVTPQYVRGLSPARELPIVWKITLGSLRNKFLFILPAAMVLSWIAPWVLPILLIVGGTYLCFEGAEKVLGWLGVAHEDEHVKSQGDPLLSAQEREKKIVRSAVRTDLVLSTEIMLIALGSVDDPVWWERLLIMGGVALLMTALVYGVVAILVKLDDLGLHMTTHESRPFTVTVGLGLVKGMPKVFSLLGVVGTIAMLWVGGHIFIENISHVGFHGLHDVVSMVTAPVIAWGVPALAWVAETVCSGAVGLALGLVVVGLVWVGKKIRSLL